MSCSGSDHFHQLENKSSERISELRDENFTQVEDLVSTASSSESADHCHLFEDESKFTEKISDLLDGQFVYDIQTTNKSVSKTLLQVGEFESKTWLFS